MAIMFTPQRAYLICLAHRKRFRCRSVFPAPPDAAPFFCRPTSHGSGLTPFRPESSELYSPYSFWQGVGGGDIYAYQAGVPDQVIKLHGDFSALRRLLSLSIPALVHVHTSSLNYGFGSLIENTVDSDI